VSEVESLLKRDDVLIWVDIPECGDEAITLLTDVLGCHPPAVRDCMERNRVPRVRIYPHQQLLILHGPERGPSGHVHCIELDQIISDKYIVTVHGPLNPAVDPAVALRETEAVRRRLSSVYGVNIIVNGHTRLTQLIVVLAIMTVMSITFLT
jgi:magnesium transporter